MRYAVTLFAALFLYASPALAQEEWAEMLSQDLVETRDGQMIFEDYDLCEIDLPGRDAMEYQIQTRAEAPAEGTISRDSFVQLTSELSVTMFYQMFATTGVGLGEFLRSYSCEEIENPIGTPDLELNLYMTGDGLQIETINNKNEQTNRRTLSWGDVFEGS